MNFQFDHGTFHLLQSIVPLIIILLPAFITCTRHFVSFAFPKPLKFIFNLSSFFQFLFFPLQLKLPKHRRRQQVHVYKYTLETLGSTRWSRGARGTFSRKDISCILQQFCWWLIKSFVSWWIKRSSELKFFRGNSGTKFIDSVSWRLRFRSLSFKCFWTQKVKQLSHDVRDI